jgi:DNA replication protein DnaC
MIARNLGHHALVRGQTGLSVTASDMLNDLAAKDGRIALHRPIRRYCHPALLVADEIGALTYDTRHAELLFEVVSRRYAEKKPVIITTKRVFQKWNEVFPNAASVVTLIDRLVHRSERINIKGESYRPKEAKDRANRKAAERSSKKKGLRRLGYDRRETASKPPECCAY